MIPYHPIHVLFSIGNFKVYSWGFFVGLGVLIALYLALKNNPKEENEIVNSFLVVALFSILGGRLLFVLGEWSYYSRHPLEILNLSGGGMALLGAIVLGLLAFIVYFKIRHKNYKRYLDIYAPYIPLAQSIGRIGCFFNGCCYGSLTNVPWGITYLGGIRHPAQLYESVLDFLLFLFLYKLRNKHYTHLFGHKIEFRRGSKFVLYLTSYSLIRFVLEFFRDDIPANIFGFVMRGNLFNQIMYGIIFILGIIYLFFTFKNLSRNYKTSLKRKKVKHNHKKKK